MNTLVHDASRRIGAIWPYALLLALVQGIIAFMFYKSSDGYRSIMGFDSGPHLIGTLAMMSIQPAYLLGSLLFMHREMKSALHALTPIAPPDLIERTAARADALPPLSLIAVPIGMAFGIYQNSGVFDSANWINDMTLRDWGVMIGNAIIWGTVALLLTWTIPAALRLNQLGASLDVDLYKPQQIRPLPMLATKYVLIIAGSLAFMPLQALDAEFRWVNYQAGLTVGLPAALLLFVVPIWGLRGAIKRRRLARLAELEAELERTDREDLVRLEAVSAHISRIQSMPNWPIDVALLLRILGYVIIAPLAWVGAALVEGVVDGFTF